MDVARPSFVPDPTLSREDMTALQREIAAVAEFVDRHSVDVAALGDDGESSPLVAGVDQAFVDDRAVSAAIVLQGGEVIDRAHAAVDLEHPYIPGLLAFREGGSILAAFAELSVRPDVALFDGSGRIHYREAGLATHVGVVLDLPSIGVAKRLLCGRPRGSTADLPAGSRVPIEANEEITADTGTVVGHAVQTRQFDGPNRHVNPVYVSPGHRVGADTAASIVLACAVGYKLPEPIRLADAYAAELTATEESSG